MMRESALISSAGVIGESLAPTSRVCLPLWSLKKVLTVTTSVSFLYDFVEDMHCKSWLPTSGLSKSP
jgi:hypothetical protein